MSMESAVKDVPRTRPQGQDLVPFEKLRLLVIDDNAEVRGMLAAALREAGATVLETGSTRQALEHIEQDKVHAAIVDLIMPDVHGLDLLRAIRRRQEGGDTPALVLCALPRGTTRDKAEADVLAIPGTAFLDKPVTARELRTVLEQLLGGA